MKRTFIEKFLYRNTKNYSILLSKKIAQKYNFIVQNGLFKGLILNKDSYWGFGDLGNKTIGIYEQQIQDLIKSIQKEFNFTSFINIGGADGFFAVGCLVNRLFKYSYVFEKSYVGRNSILKCAKNNLVDTSMVILKEVSSNNFFNFFPEHFSFKDSVILCDIEGDEYNLFTDHILQRLQETNIIIEIHSAEEKKKHMFKEKILKYFDLSIMWHNVLSLENYIEISKLSDIERNLLLSEGRSSLGEWWHLIPKSKLS